MFYGVDLPRLRAAVGSGDDDLYGAVLARVEDPDGWRFSDRSPRDLLRRLIDGDAAGDGPKYAADYGYLLKDLCEHLGGGQAAFLDGECACVADLPYDLRLPDSGPPVEIPYDDIDFPEIGYLEPGELDAELDALDAPPGRPKKPPWRLRVFAWVFKKRTGVTLRSLHVPDADEAAEEVEEYRLALNDAKARGTGLISFRH